MFRVKKSDSKRHHAPAATSQLPPVAQALIRTKNTIAKPCDRSISPSSHKDYFQSVYASINDLQAADRLTTLKNFYTKVRYFNRKHTERRKNDTKEWRKLSRTKRDTAIYEKISTPSREYLSTTSDFEGEEIRTMYRFGYNRKQRNSSSSIFDPDKCYVDIKDIKSEDFNLATSMRSVREYLELMDTLKKVKKRKDKDTQPHKAPITITNTTKNTNNAFNAKEIQLLSGTSILSSIKESSNARQMALLRNLAKKIDRNNLLSESTLSYATNLSRNHLNSLNMLKRSRSNNTASKMSVVSSDSLSVAGKTFNNDTKLSTHYERSSSAHQTPTKTFTSSSFNSFDVRSKETPFRFVVTNRDRSKAILNKPREIVKLPPIEPVPTARIAQKEAANYVNEDAMSVSRFPVVVQAKESPKKANISAVPTGALKRSLSEVRSKRAESEPRRVPLKLQPAETRHSIDASGILPAKTGLKVKQESFDEVQNDEYFELNTDSFLRDANEEALLETLAKSEGNYKYVATSTSKLLSEGESSPMGTWIAEASARLPPIKVDANESVYRFYERKNL